MVGWPFVSRRFRLTAHENIAAGARALLPALQRHASASAKGISCPIPRLIVVLKTAFGPVTVRCKLDTGADMMSIPIAVARRIGLTFSMENRGEVNTLGGNAPCYYDVVEIVYDLAGRSLSWPCCFVDSREDRVVLGRAGFFDEFEFTIRRGYLIVSHRLPWTQWFTRWLRSARPKVGTL